MPRFLKRISKKAGMRPGALVFVGQQRAERVRIVATDYGPDRVTETEVDIDEAVRLKETDTVSWIDVRGLHDVELIDKLGAAFGLHPLVLEDILNTGQRPKIDDFGDYLYVALRMLYEDEEAEQVVSEQISLVIGDGFVLSFQEQEKDVFEPVRDRIRAGKGRIRKSGTDYLFYALIDAVVDHYFLVLESLGEQIEEMDEEVMGDPDPEMLDRIRALRHEMMYLRKTIWPMRDVVGGMIKSESDRIGESIHPFLRDVQDHVFQVTDLIEIYNDMTETLLDLYLSAVSNRMNAVMKVLTIIATIFIPITFVAGIYGMNFEFMPELHWKWSYPAVWAVIAGIAIVMLVYFRRKKWL